MFSYQAYGLGISSVIEIPEFTAGYASPDVTIAKQEGVDFNLHLSAEALEYPWVLKLGRQSARVYIKHLGIFLIEQGREITWLPSPNASEQMARFYLVGTIMAIVLYQRNFLVLHGSVIDIDGAAVIFLGNSGDGKSTTAAALHSAGYTLVNDDVAPVVLGADSALLYPGFPQIKMSQETADALGYDFSSLPVIHPQSPKRGYRPQQNVSAHPLTIKRIYVLDYGADFGCEPIPAALATMELARHSRPTTLHHRGDEQHFFQCASLAKEQTLYRLQRPQDLQRLPEIADFLRQDLALNQPVAIS